jgi:DNA-binding NarL/FixJ family response regulator
MGKIKVAIVEDDDKCRKDIVSLINGENDLECKAEYRNAEDAIAFLKHQTPDIIIVDLDLKARLTGIDVIRELKKHFDEAYLKSSFWSIPFQTAGKMSLKQSLKVPSVMF